LGQTISTLSLKDAALAVAGSVIWNVSQDKQLSLADYHHSNSWAGAGNCV
jgi:hypothetical protein